MRASSCHCRCHKSSQATRRDNCVADPPVLVHFDRCLRSAINVRLREGGGKRTGDSFGLGRECERFGWRASNSMASTRRVCPGLVDGELRGHPVRDHVSDDVVGEHVFDRSTAERAGSVRRHRRPAGGGPRTPAGPPRLLPQVPVPEWRVTIAGSTQRVDAVRAQEVRVSDRGAAPPIAGLPGKLENPARHRHGYPRVGELGNERVCHCGQPPRRRFAGDRYAATLLSTSLSCSRRRIRFFSSRASAACAAA